LGFGVRVYGRDQHGVGDAEGAIAKSCNVSAATWALDIGYGPMVKYIEDLGLLQKTGVGLPYEAHGLFRYDEFAKPLQLATVGFGQSITATPVGISSAFCMLANHGVQMKPRLIKSIDGRTVPPEEKGRPIAAEAADKTLEIMQSVIQDQHGTGFSLRIPGYVLAGKTGTAQRVGKAGGGYVSNFVGFVPSPNPKAMILVMVNHPKAKSTAHTQSWVCQGSSGTIQPAAVAQCKANTVTTRVAPATSPTRTSRRRLNGASELTMSPIPRTVMGHTKVLLTNETCTWRIVAGMR